MIFNVFFLCVQEGHLIFLSRVDCRKIFVKLFTLWLSSLAFRNHWIDDGLFLFVGFFYPLQGFRFDLLELVAFLGSIEIRCTL